MVGQEVEVKRIAVSIIAKITVIMAELECLRQYAIYLNSMGVDDGEKMDTESNQEARSTDKEG